MILIYHLKPVLDARRGPGGEDEVVVPVVRVEVPEHGVPSLLHHLGILSRAVGVGGQLDHHLLLHGLDLRLAVEAGPGMVQVSFTSELWKLFS